MGKKKEERRKKKEKLSLLVISQNHNIRDQFSAPLSFPPCISSVCHSFSLDAYRDKRIQRQERRMRMRDRQREKKLTTSLTTSITTKGILLCRSMEQQKTDSETE